MPKFIAMCLILFAYRVHSDYPLLLLSNRDESYSRETKSLHYWEDHPQILAGRDILHGGTWLGLNRQGQFAAVTNYRDGMEQGQKKSRGHLVKDFLMSSDGAKDFSKTVLETGDDYHGFNLLSFDGDDLVWVSNRFDGVQVLEPGIYGLSNHGLDTPWPKVVKGKSMLSQALEAQVKWESEPLFDLLTENTVAIDSELPNTNIKMDLERVLSPIFVKAKGYGTVSSSLLRLGLDGSSVFEQKVYKETGVEFKSLEFKK